MECPERTVKLSELVKKMKLEIIYVPGEGGIDDCENIRIGTSDINRPGLALTGFLDYFEHNRIQLLGNAEYKYLEGQSEAARKQRIETLFSLKVPCVIITHGLPVFPEISPSFMTAFPLAKIKIPPEPALTVLSEIVPLFIINEAMCV